MKPDEFLAWVDRRKKELGIKADRPIENRAGHPEAIRNVRRGRSMPKIAILRALADVLGDPPLDLLGPAGGKIPARMPSLTDLEQELIEIEARANDLRIAIGVLRGHKKAV